MKEIKLIGINYKGKQVNLQKDVYCFTDIMRTITIEYDKHKDIIYMTTHKGIYKLTKHPTQNYYYGTYNNIKIHIILKKVVGKLLYWE